MSAPDELIPAYGRLQALCYAAATLEARHPKRNVCEFEVYNRPVVAHVAWCGVVVVTDKATGKRIVQSLPGQPTTPDPAPAARP